MLVSRSRKVLVNLFL